MQVSAISHDLVTVLSYSTATILSLCLDRPTISFKRAVYQSCVLLPNLRFIRPTVKPPATNALELLLEGESLYSELRVD
jgi:hypothetical protein